MSDEQDRKNAAYKDGYDKGRDGSWVDRVVRDVLPDCVAGYTDEDLEIHDKGMKQGEEDRAKYGRRE